MLFTLEALNAGTGDSLLLHCGTAAEPLLVVIDGGPAGVYKNALSPRLNELKQQRAPDGSLPIEVLMLSHIDDDHINGLLAMARELEDKQDNQVMLPYEVFTLWHNSFDDITGNDSDDFAGVAIDALQKPPPEGASEKARTAGLAVVASVAQGEKLRNAAAALNWTINDPFEGLVIAPGEAPIGDATTLTVIAPHVDQLKRLHEEWEEYLEAKAAKAAKKQDEIVGRVAAYKDNSVFNLASIVVLAEAGGKRMLLTGDARGDHVLEGIDKAGLADADGKLRLDVLKLPHHGSIHNVEQNFFDRLPAEHYVISANGLHGNPETETLEMIVAANKDNDDFTIHFTNDSGSGDINERVKAFVDKHEQAGRTFKVEVREPDALGLSIHLGDEQP